MKGPNNSDLPFFAYGVFREGELGFLSIADLIENLNDSSVPGTLYLRDGLPLFEPNGRYSISGNVIHFKNGTNEEAYARINRLEPDKQYFWNTVEVDGTECNCLIGKSPTKGSTPLDNGWDGQKDPLFTDALDVIEETLKNSEASKIDDLRPMFRLQMAYLLLWSSIERYVSLRYHLGDKAWDKVKQLATEQEFADALQANVKGLRYVQRADAPQTRYTLDYEKPEKSLEYYYQIRSNITHRGKGIYTDHKIVEDSLTELLKIFRHLLTSAFERSSSSLNLR